MFALVKLKDLTLLTLLKQYPHGRHDNICDPIDQYHLIDMCTIHNSQIIHTQRREIIGIAWLVTLKASHLYVLTINNNKGV